MASERVRGGRRREPGGERLTDPAVEAALERLRGLWAGYWPAAAATEMAADVLERFGAAVRAWDLRALRPLGQNAVGLVCAASRGALPVVLKLNPRGHVDDAQMAGEGAALEFWRPTGIVVELLDQRDGGFTMLLERLEPGGTLGDSDVPTEGRLTELGRLAARLHAAGRPPGSFQHLRDFASIWHAALEPADLAELEELVVPRDDDVLVHLDLHDWNVLASGREWKVIDPKGLRGDRHADNWALLDDWLLATLPEDPAAAADRAAAWLDRYSRAAGMDAGRVRRWTRLRALAEAHEFRSGPGRTPETDAWATGMERMAAALLGGGR